MQMPCISFVSYGLYRVLLAVGAAHNRTMFSQTVEVCVYKHFSLIFNLLFLMFAVVSIEIRTLMREKEAQSNALSALRSAVGRYSVHTNT